MGPRRARTLPVEIVVPELELVVMIAAGNYGDFKTWHPFQNLVAMHIIPAIVE